MIYTYTLNMKSGYNCEVDVDHVPMDEEYWSTSERPTGLS